MLDPGSDSFPVEDLAAIEAIEARMRSGRSSRAGFLGPDEHLADVIAADTKTLEALAITHKQVGDRLTSLTGQAFRAWELAARAGEDIFEAQRNGALVEGKFRVGGVGWMGAQECPFAAPSARACGYGSYDFSITNETTGESIGFPQLMAHLVGDHHFFEGETHYRLDPAKAVRVLELEPGKDYTPVYETEVIWRQSASTSSLVGDTMGLRAQAREASKSFRVDYGTKVYLSPDGQEAIVICHRTRDKAESIEIDGGIYYGSIYRGCARLKRVENKFVALVPGTTETT